MMLLVVDKNAKQKMRAAKKTAILTIGQENQTQSLV